MGVALRPATLDDVPGMARTVLEGFDGYRAFAPEGWAPPGRAVELERIRSRFTAPDVWALVAVDGRGRQAGHVSLLDDSEDPGTSAYLWHLFVRTPHQGTGLAVTLHDAFLDAARARGYSRARLSTPAGQARARRFYEREGWRTDAHAELHPLLGLELLTYRRDGLASSASPLGVRS
ncbi:MAG: N-acetyltransferase family protein [Solirubrobacteraceae bacterium]